MSKIIEFSELLVTKLFHDIAGTIGAINNGFELLETEKSIEMNYKILDLIKSNSAEIQSKIIFFRYLYGKNKHDGQIDVTGFPALLSDFFSYDKILVNHLYDINILDEVNFTNIHGKLIANLCLVSAATLIQSRIIEIEIYKCHGKPTIKISTKGEKTKVINETIAILENHELIPINLSNVQMHYASKIASEIGAVISCANAENAFSISISL